jgi:hypothetical protein
MQEFILAETSEIQESIQPYGDIQSNLWVYRIVASIDDSGFTMIKYEAGCQYREYDEIEFDYIDDTVDFDKKDFNLDELKRFNEALICK